MISTPNPKTWTQAITPCLWNGLGVSGHAVFCLPITLTISESNLSDLGGSSAIHSTDLSSGGGLGVSDSP